jgi:hypothetical protein
MSHIAKSVKQCDSLLTSLRVFCSFRPAATRGSGETAVSGGNRRRSAVSDRCLRGPAELKVRYDWNSSMALKERNSSRDGKQH